MDRSAAVLSVTTDYVLNSSRRILLFSALLKIIIGDLILVLFVNV